MPLVFPPQYPLLPHRFGGKFKCFLLVQRVDIASCFPDLGKNDKPGKCFHAFALISCQYIKSFPKYFRLHITETSLGLLEQHFFC